PVPIAQTSAKMELTLRLQETDQGLRGMLEYQTDLFEPATIARLVSSYLCILEAVATSPKLPLSHLPWLPAVVRDQLLLEWSTPETLEDRQEGLHQLFEQQVERAPDAIALVYEDEHLTYAELNARANHLATLLRARGVGPEVLVGVYLPRSLDLIISVLGILKAGGAYFALDLDAPPQRLASLLELAEPSLVVSNAALAPSLPEQIRSHSARIFHCELVGQTMPERAPANPVNTSSPQNLAYLVFTSGSTGQPKGVLVPHRGAVSYLSAIIHCFHLHPGMTVLQNPPLTFDAAVRDIFSTLLTGARLVMMPTRDAKDTGRILAHLRQHQVTHVLSLVPSFLRALLDTAEPAARPLFPSLRFLLVGGEHLPLSLVAQARRVFNPQIEITNHYGPTETTMSATFYRLPAWMQLTGQAGENALSGRPFPNKQVYLLDRYGSPVPQGVVGEVYVGGPGVTRGYLGRPQETAERFVPHPFSSEPGERLYRTGDLARYRPDGVIEFLGRRDRQVKLRGYRVELGEIEAVLRQHTGVREVVVMMREDQPGDQRLVAYIVPQPHEQPAVSSLRGHAQARLPGALVPSAFQLLTAWPLLPNGKLDRGALPVPDGNATQREERSPAPRTATEELLVNIWSQVLHLEQVGIYDHFFELGGHSLLATQVMARVNKTFQVKVPLHVFFLTPTIAGLAEALVQYETRPGQIAAIARLRQKLNAMSPDEVHKSLRARKGDE
ncbi:MAG TPA: amino acid adenylation domain-containing protein, partial [Ktedonobacteraceae bacterium]